MLAAGVAGGKRQRPGGVIENPSTPVVTGSSGDRNPYVESNRDQLEGTPDHA
ncbi:hypothetical protein [Mycobacterium persicum]|uniref:hypothetical protein n=1 Tax=Mycobacterium persicum TaxID=1487726 RepID=UPI000A488974|nr:hypothetical protein [Mycobacterium persicum]